MARRRQRSRRRVYARPVRRRRARRVGSSYYFRAKRRRRSGGRTMGFLGGKGKPIIDGMVAGALGQVLTNVIGAYGHPASALGVGFIRNNPVLLTEGSRGIGALLVSNFVGGNGGGGYQI